MTTIFEYKAYLAQIDQTNSYIKLRKMYKSFIESNEMNNFYRVHCVAKLVSKFKSLTNSYIIKDKTYSTSKHIFNIALSDLNSIDDLKNLIQDWPCKDLSQYITIPTNSKSLINLSKYVNFDEMFINESRLNKLCFRYNDSVGQGRGLELRTRHVLSIVHYLKPIKDTNLYINILSEEIDTHKRLTYKLDPLIRFKEELKEEIKSIEEAIKELQ